MQISESRHRAQAVTLLEAMTREVGPAVHSHVSERREIKSTSASSPRTATRCGAWVLCHSLLDADLIPAARCVGCYGSVNV